MTPKCSVCLSPDRADVDAMLVAGNGLRGVASRFHVSRSSLHRHSLHAGATGQAKPNGATTTPATASAGAPPATDRPTPTGRAQGKVTAPIASPSPPSVPEAARVESPELAADLQVIVRGHLLALTSDDALTHGDKSKLQSAAVAALALLAKLEGRTGEINEARIAKHPAFRRMLDALTSALAPWPEALLACAEALRQLGAFR